MGFSPHQSMSYNSIMTLITWSQLRPHRLRAQSHKTATPQPQMPTTSPVVTCASQLWLTAINRRFLWHPQPRFNNLLEQLTELQKTIYLLRLPVYYERIQVRNSQMEETRSSHALPRCANLPAPPPVHQPGSSPNLPWTTVFKEPNLQPSQPSQRSVGWA